MVSQARPDPPVHLVQPAQLAYPEPALSLRAQSQLLVTCQVLETLSATPTSSQRRRISTFGTARRGRTSVRSSAPQAPRVPLAPRVRQAWADLLVQLVTPDRSGLRGQQVQRVQLVWLGQLALLVRRARPGLSALSALLARLARLGRPVPQAPQELAALWVVRVRLAQRARLDCLAQPGRPARLGLVALLAQLVRLVQQGLVVQPARRDRQGLVVLLARLARLESRAQPARRDRQGLVVLLARRAPWALLAPLDPPVRAGPASQLRGRFPQLATCQVPAIPSVMRISCRPRRNFMFGMARRGTILVRLSVQLDRLARLGRLALRDCPAPLVPHRLWRAQPVRQAR